MDQYENLDIVDNARADSVIYGLARGLFRKKDRPAVYGKKLSIQDDFTLSDEKIGDYFMATRRVLTNVFDKKDIMAYVTAQKRIPKASVFFLVQFYQNSFKSFVHVRKNLR